MRRSILIAFLALSAMLTTPVQGQEAVSKEAAYILIDNLLQLSDRPKDITQSLSKYKEWEAQYEKVSESAHLGPKQLAVYFFVVFISEARNMVHTQEDIGHEIVPLYNRNKVRFLHVLDQNPAFIPAVCGDLADYFSMEGKEEDLDGFITENRPLMVKHLYKPQAEACISELERHNLAFKADRAKRGGLTPR